MPPESPITWKTSFPAACAAAAASGTITRKGSVRLTLLVMGGFSKCGLFFGFAIGSRNARLVLEKRFAFGDALGIK
jgi:hypothetical protein